MGSRSWVGVRFFICFTWNGGRFFFAQGGEMIGSFADFGGEGFAVTNVVDGAGTVAKGGDREGESAVIGDFHFDTNCELSGGFLFGGGDGFGEVQGRGFGGEFFFGDDLAGDNGDEGVPSGFERVEV